MDSGFSEVFLIDSNILIAPFHSYYAFEFAPEFWSFIEQNILIKKIILLDIVFDEITAGTDELSAWIKKINGLETIDHKNYIAQYADILNFIQTSGFYKIEALHSWSMPTAADPFLIAAAIANQYTIITGERPNNGLNKTNPSPRAKIPDICSQFNVKWNNLFYMLRQLGFRR
ncbi:MAG: DUF4411 family protein [Spirochaetaceae bacterium]|jgi:hypothetical protein|nr:DUF4411 family protein [Spirochaetaceae bacterium]